MATLKSIVLQWDGAADQTIPVGAPQATVVTPFNPEGVDLAHAKPHAMTEAEYMADPGKYDWLNTDYLRIPPPGRWYDPLLPDEESLIGEVGAYVYLTSLPEQTTASWFKKDRQQAARWWKEKYKVDFETLIPKLGPMQKKKTGMQ